MFGSKFSKVLNKWVLSASLVFLLAVSYIFGYMHGRHIHHVNDMDYAKAIQVIDDHQKTWRVQEHSSPQSNVILYGSKFQPRFTGTAGYIVFTNTSNGKVYILQTAQDRVVDGKKMPVCEPPSGFYNGEFNEAVVPHVVAEKAETEIDKAYRLGNPIARSVAYQQAFELLKAGKLPDSKYTVDKNLLESLARETLEETGFNLEKVFASGKYDQKIIGEIDIPSAYVIVRQIDNRCEDAQ